MPVMLLVGGGMKVALATTHLALSKVPAAITRPLLDSVIAVLDRDLRLRFGIAHPRIAVAGLNPHAGESGYLGREEIDVIAPAIAQARLDGIDASGPWPADTLFVPSTARGQDALLAMYHDQGLAPLKFASFGHGVNVTLGLPLIRTSVDHGTALDLAGSGKADPGSLQAAIELAEQLVDIAATAGADPGSSAAALRTEPRAKPRTEPRAKPRNQPRNQPRSKPRSEPI
jgi:4-hydroxythreonine-4-phosphate dehydrogenase